MSWKTKVLATIKPRMSILPQVKAFLRLLKKPEGVRLQIGGSVAKDTYLATEFDCDIFVQFSKKYDSTLISDVLEQMLTQAKLPFSRLHGSRDYFQVTHKNIMYELVPVMHIKKASDAQNITDQSPLHVDWITSRMNSSLKDDMRLARSFCKANRVYGAESYIGGFSGHVLDTLIVHYRGFIPLLKATSAWSDKHVIDPAKWYKGKDALPFLNPSKTTSPIIVIDPIMKERNAASALSYDMCTRFKQCAKQFLKNPSERYFVQKPLSQKTWTKKKGKHVLLTFYPHVGKKDVTYAKVKSAIECFSTQFDKKGFTIIDATIDWSGGHVKWYVLVERVTLPAQKIYEGPPMTMISQVEAFKIKHPRAYCKQKKWYAKEPQTQRSIQAASLAIHEICKAKYAKYEIEVVR